VTTAWTPRSSAGHRLRSSRAPVVALLAVVVASGACGSSSAPPRDGGADHATSTGAAGSGGAGGTSGTSGAAGASGATGGAGQTGAGGAGGQAAMGGQPLGGACANTGNCTQADGAAVCCVNTCVLEAQCPTGNMFLPCASGADCARFGGGKVCCKEQTGGSVMQFCTKPSECAGTVVP
jgi:hypothetical protein